MAGSLAHVWLADAVQESWLISNMIFVAGLCFLARRGAALGWVLCGVAKRISLLFLRDHLTQSMIVGFIVSVGAFLMIWDSCQNKRGFSNLSRTTINARLVFALFSMFVRLLGRGYLCDDRPLPFADDGIVGIEIFKDSLRFQKTSSNHAQRAVFIEKPAIDKPCPLSYPAHILGKA